MSAYALVNIEAVTDPAGFDEYRSSAPATVQSHGGEYLVVGGDAALLEGAWTPGTLVLLRFPDRATAQGWWASAEYAPHKATRQGASTSTFVLVDGLDA
jgi:uncharacterized protein (DUF1330 family)